MPASPVLSPTTEEYVTALGVYEEHAAEAVRRFEAFGELDASLKETQDTLHSILAVVDEQWEAAESSAKGSKVNAKALDELKKATASAGRLLEKQSKILDDLDKAAGRAARGFARMAEAAKELAADSKGARESLEKELEKMAKMKPGIEEKKQRAVSASRH